MKTSIPIALALILTSPVPVLAGKVQNAVYPIRMFASTTSSRVARSSYFTLDAKKKSAADYSARSKAIAACELAAKGYKLKEKAPTKALRKYAKDFIFKADPSPQSPEFMYLSQEFVEMLPNSKGVLVPHYFIDFHYNCHGKWIDTNPGRHN